MIASLARVHPLPPLGARRTCALVAGGGRRWPSPPGSSTASPPTSRCCSPTPTTTSTARCGSSSTPTRCGFIWTSDAWHQWLGPWTIAPLYYLFVAAVLAVDRPPPAAADPPVRARRGRGGGDGGAGAAHRGAARRVGGRRLRAELPRHRAVGVHAHREPPLAAARRRAGAARRGGGHRGGPALAAAGRSAASCSVSPASRGRCPRRSCRWPRSGGRGSRGTRREAVQAAAVLALSAAAAILPWTARNVFVIGDLVPVESISVYNFWDDNAFVDGDRRRHQESRDRRPAHARRAAQPGHVVRLAGDRRATPAASRRRPGGTCVHIVRLDGLHLLLRIEEPHPRVAARRADPARRHRDAGHRPAVPRLRGRRRALARAIADPAVVGLLPADGGGRSSTTRSATAARCCPSRWRGRRGAWRFWPIPARRRRTAVRAAVLVGAGCAPRECSRRTSCPPSGPCGRPGRCAGCSRALDRGGRRRRGRCRVPGRQRGPVAARPWLVFGSALARAGEPARALDAYRRAEERKAYVWTPRLVRPAAARRGRPARRGRARRGRRLLLARRSRGSPWRSRGARCPRRARTRSCSPAATTAPCAASRCRAATIAGRWHRAWIRLRPVTSAAAYVVSLDMGFPPPSPLRGGGRAW